MIVLSISPVTLLLTLSRRRLIGCFFCFFAEQDLTVYSVIVLGEIRAGTVSRAVRLDLAEVSFDSKILQLGLKGVFFGVPTFFLNKTDLRWTVWP